MELYFYTHLESDFHRERVLALLDGKMILSKPSKFNDPFDTRWDIFHHVNGIDYSLPHDVGDSYRMLCFSEAWDSLLMWGHYAHGHRGICLKLAVNSDILPSKGDLLEPVRYSTCYPKSRIDDINETDGAWDTCLLTKSVDWLYEKEWRYITSHFENDSGAGCDYVQSDSFVKVQVMYLGEEFRQQECQINASYSLCLGSTIFDELERDDGAELDKMFSSGNRVEKAKKDAIERERFLMKLTRRDVSLFECRKKMGAFGLERSPFEYGPSVSLKIECLARVSYLSEA